MEVPSPSGALVEMLAAMTVHDVADLAERLGVPVNDVSRLALAAAKISGEGVGSPSQAASTPEAPSPDPDAPSLVEQARQWTDSGTWIQVERRDLVRELADRIEELEAVLAREVPKDDADALRTVLTYELGFEDGKEEALKEAYRVATMHEKDRPVDLASDLRWNEAPLRVFADAYFARYPDEEGLHVLHENGRMSDPRLIPLPSGRIAVAAQDLRVGDVVDGWNVREVQKDDGVWVALASRGITADTSYADGTLVLLDKAAES